MALKPLHNERITRFKKVYFLITVTIYFLQTKNLAD